MLLYCSVVYTKQITVLVAAVMETAGVSQFSVSAQKLQSSLWNGQIQHPGGKFPLEPLDLITMIPEWCTVHHVSSVMYTTAMQQLEGSKALDDWEPVEQVWIRVDTSP
jgi:hypothetical protein